MAEETKEIVENKVRKIKNMILRVEIVIGVIAMIFGIGLTVLVWGEGFFPGALMLIVTGLINIFLAVKELLDPTEELEFSPIEDELAPLAEELETLSELSGTTGPAFPYGACKKSEPSSPQATNASVQQAKETGKSAL